MSTSAIEICCTKVKKSPLILCSLIESDDFALQKQKTFDARPILCYSVLAVEAKPNGSVCPAPLSSLI